MFLASWCPLRFLVVYLISFGLTKPPPPPPLSSRARWTTLHLAARDKIFKVYWNPKMIKRRGKHILIHLRDSNLMVCKMIKCTLIAIFTSQHILYYTSFLKLLQLTDPNGEVRIQSWATDMWKSHKIWIKSDINSIQFDSTDKVRKGRRECTAGPWVRTRFKVYVGNVDGMCIVCECMC